MDDLVFTRSLIEEMNQVDMRAECFPLCHRRELCNLVLYNSLTRKCRVYTEAFGLISDGTVETGWQYYGITCVNFKLDNAHADVDVINTVPKDVCNSNIIAAADNTSSCHIGASWEVVPVKCLSCYTGLPQQYAYPYAGHTEELTFDLAAGMKLKMEVSGDRTLSNEVWMVTLTEDIVYVLSLRWSTTPTVAIFNTGQGGEYGVEERLYDLTFVDGDLWMANQMRLPFIDVRRVKVKGFTALHSFHVGYDMC
ncbi:uncharacterized protein LOC124274645 [Haliotis rubra]|uniref:uncharacterized protein LOC124274645 n=1 Tax=Haliotis rubra TaxID=36100 RepID=UPI001EE5B625|nr:uncharacterized protein LOC124274645 [Haliotis rubra]